jgi:CxxC-x17-CxxC domain-containing protein
MNDFKKNNRFGDKRGGGFNKGGFRPSFGGGGGKSFGGGRPPLEMFSATCASCSKTCEVPFKPNGKKPVYCKECFAANGGPEAREGGNDRGGDRNERFAPRRDFDRPRPAFRPDSRPEGGAGLGELKRTIEAMNSKLDKLVSLMSAGVSVAKPVVVSEASVVDMPAHAGKKSATKKATKKKK